MIVYGGKYNQNKILQICGKNCAVVSISDRRKKRVYFSKQILRSGTSIGANVKEATQAESRADFIHKNAIALKEASETEYWLELLRETNFIDDKAFESINDDCLELIKMLTSIIKTSQQNS